MVVPGRGFVCWGGERIGAGGKGGAEVVEGRTFPGGGSLSSSIGNGAVFIYLRKKVR